MKEWIDTYLVKTNIWVSLCFTSLLIFFQLSFYEVNLYVWGIVFFGTLAVYNFTRIRNLRDLIRFNHSNKLQISLTYIGMIATLVCVILRGFELKTFLYLGVLGFISFCYSLPFKGMGLRTIPFIKLFLIAFVWAGSSIGLLLVVHHELVHYKLLFFSIMFFVVGITIPFDIRDEFSDEKELKTIPQLMGMKKPKALAIIMLILSGLFFYWEFNAFNLPMICWFFSLLIALFFILGTNERKSFFYFSFWVESCSLMPLLAYLFLS